MPSVEAGCCGEAGLARASELGELRHAVLARSFVWFSDAVRFGPCDEISRDQQLRRLDSKGALKKVSEELEPSPKEADVSKP